ncbi:hypothetical protein GCM10010123_22140 [Pilimelia anulata]|uniref:Uncharacterized protein n=1 Tax=Pilimelia anulata TaxID=53371 RepID=A0A8J3F9A4_9ACTN|nr:hypothetical protein [Pilimelia anulata]GGJ91899.1 hypothetical protein GCM10010123_22140 [Pilimelia anulata]
MNTLRAAAGLALAAGAVGLTALAAPATAAPAANPAGLRPAVLDLPDAGARSAAPVCNKGLVVQHTRSDRFLQVHPELSNVAQNLVRADKQVTTAADAAGVSRFELCLTKDLGNNSYEAYLRSATVRKFVAVEKTLPAAYSGAVIANAGSLSAETTLTVQTHTDPLSGTVAYTFKSPVNGKYLSVERNYTGDYAKVVRAARDAALAGEQFALFDTEPGR